MIDAEFTGTVPKMITNNIKSQITSTTTTNMNKVNGDVDETNKPHLKPELGGFLL
jgi:hypothetical protein